jgi:hypothetical protein
MKPQNCVRLVLLAARLGNICCRRGREAATRARSRVRRRMQADTPHYGAGRDGAVNPLSAQNYARSRRRSNWLPDKDSNLNKQSQNLLCYHYTIGQEKFGGEKTVEPATGIEPATACLQNRCSTVELHRRWSPGPHGSGAAGTKLGGVKEHRRPVTPGGGAELPDDRFGGPPGTRTPNQLIKSQLLYH